MRRLRRLALGMLGGKSAAVASFAPTDIEGLLFWTSSDSGLYTDDGKTTAATSMDDAIAVWADRSGNGKDLTQAADATKRPKLKLLGTTPVVRSDGLNDIMGCARLLTDDNFTIVAVARNATDAATDRSLLAQFASSVSGRTLFMSTPAAAPNGRLRLFFNNGSSQTVLTTSTPWDRIARIMCVESNGGGTTHIRIDGGEAEGVVTDQVWTPLDAAFSVFGYGFGAIEAMQMAADAYEILVYTPMLNDADRVQVENYLREKWLIGDPDRAVIANADYLTIPTYDESGESVHPSVYDAGTGATWNGHRYWMAFTPYPGATAAYENPSIVVSGDGETWTVPDGLTNPIDPQPAEGINSDPHLMMEGGALYCFYRQHVSSGGNVTETLCERHSVNGITWTDETQPFEIVTAGAASRLLSPTIFKSGSQYWLYTIDNTRSPRVMQRRTASAIAGPWSDPVDCSFYTSSLGAPPATMWHIDIMPHGDGYYGFISTDSIGYMAHSTDGMVWQISRTPSISGRTGNWDERIYRGCLVKTPSGFDLWYSAYSEGSPTVWHIAKTVVTGMITD